MKRNKLIFILPLAIMTAIFLLSSQNSIQSGSLSQELTNIILDGIGHLIDPNISEMPGIWNTMHILVRKAAHFFIYMLLGFFLYMSIRIIVKKAIFLTGSICLAFAVSDEIHQFFVPGRSMQIIDVGIDMTGAMVGITISFLIYRLKQRISRS